MKASWEFTKLLTIIVKSQVKALKSAFYGYTQYNIKTNSIEISLSRISDRINSSFSSQIQNEPNKLECLITVGWKDMLVINTLA